MLHPFGDEPEEEEDHSYLHKGQRSQSLLQDADPHDSIVLDEITSADVKDHHVFDQSIDLVMRPHFSSAAAIEDRLLGPAQSPQVKTVIDRHRDRLQDAINKLRKNYQVYIQTAMDEPLQKEAMRLERRFFKEKADSNQLNFLRMKRYYEKVRTFNHIAKNCWREVSKSLDTLTVLNETRALAIQLEKEYLRNLILLMRRTDSYLDELGTYLKVGRENSDNITGSIKVQMDYDPTVRYSRAAFLGTEIEEVLDEPELDDQIIVQEEADTGSIAQNIVLETREHKLNRASIISVKILGSRDWNRTPHYRFEVPLVYFEQCVEQFKLSYHVNIKEDNIKSPVPAASIGVGRGVGEDAIADYHRMLLDTLESIATLILDEDFPGLARPDVFLYHCGANVFYAIALKLMRSRGLGEMLYLDDNQNSMREFPEELIQKILIDWWADHFDKISGEDVDSYLTYSRQLEMVKREFRILYDEGVLMMRRERPGLNYLRIEKLIKDNRDRVFGLRKVEIFKRFIPGTILE